MTTHHDRHSTSGIAPSGFRLPPGTQVGGVRLLVSDLARSVGYYEQVLGLTALTSDARFRAYDVGGQSVLLLFRRGATLETVRMPGGTIPPHDGHGPLHMAFAVATDALPQWEQRLREQGIAIEGRTDWSRGGHSIYFRDPDGNLVEVSEYPGSA